MKKIVILCLLLTNINLVFADNDRDIDYTPKAVAAKQVDKYFETPCGEGQSWECWVIVSSGTKNQGVTLWRGNIRNTVTSGNSFSTELHLLISKISQ